MAEMTSIFAHPDPCPPPLSHGLLILGKAWLLSVSGEQHSHIPIKGHVLVLMRPGAALGQYATNWLLYLAGSLPFAPTCCHPAPGSMGHSPQGGNRTCTSMRLKPAADSSSGNKLGNGLLGWNEGAESGITMGRESMHLYAKSLCEG